MYINHINVNVNSFRYFIYFSNYCSLMSFIQLILCLIWLTHAFVPIGQLLVQQKKLEVLCHNMLWTNSSQTEGTRCRVLEPTFTSMKLLVNVTWMYFQIVYMQLLVKFLQQFNWSKNKNIISVDLAKLKI